MTTRSRWALPVFLFLVFNVFFYFTLSINTNHDQKTNGVYRINDFSYIIALIKSFWFNEIRTIYTFDSQIKSIFNTFGVITSTPMSMGLTPTILYLFLPLSLIAKFNVTISYTVWITSSLVILFSALEKTSEHIAERGSGFRPMFFILVCVFTFSFSMFNAISLGQLSIATCGLLLFLILEVMEARKSNRKMNPWLVYPIMIILSIKLHYFIIGVSILFIFGYFTESIISIVMLCSILTIIGAYNGFFLIKEWIEQVRHFSITNLPLQYQTHFHTYKTLVTFRSAFSQFIGDYTSILTSYIISILVFIAIFSLSIIKKFRFPLFGEMTKRVSECRLAIAMIAVILLFMPYLGSYDDLLIILGYIFLYFDPQYEQRDDVLLIIVLFLTCLVVNFNLFPITRPIFPFWIMKLLVLWFLFCNLKRNTQRERVAH